MRIDAGRYPYPPSGVASAVIDVRGVSKVYRVYDRPQDRLKQMLWRGRRSFGRDFWALREVTLQVGGGETVGIVGRNGSGKSTLLQIIAGTLTPSAGQVQVAGRVAALLELGSGFNPEFSGRENVMLNGAILGIEAREMEERYGAIVAFANIGEFIDQPVKIYSSGMLVRLAFAVQAHIDPEILIVDEALAVGDMYFQSKCMARIAELQKRGTAILLVSHSIGSVKAIASRCILLEQGRILLEGSPDVVCDRYASLMLSNGTGAAGAPAHGERGVTRRSELQPPFAQRITERFGTGAARYVECYVVQGGREATAVVHGRDCEVHAFLEYHRDVADFGEVGLVIRTLEGLDLFAVNSFLLDATYPPQRDHVVAHLIFRFNVMMAPGTYSASLGYRVPAQGEYVDKVFNAVVFSVAPANATPMPCMFTVPGHFEYEVIDRDSSVVE